MAALAKPVLPAPTPLGPAHSGKADAEILNLTLGAEQDPATAHTPSHTLGSDAELLPKLVSPLAWSGADFATDDGYTYVLTNDEVLEVENGLRYFRSLDELGHAIEPATFPLPTLNSKLKLLRDELFKGRGFINIRGIDPDKFSPEDNVLVFLGISKYMGTRVGKQDLEGYMLGHIRDSAESQVDQEQRPFRDSRLPLTFHTDSYTDILGMQTRGLAASGGGHLIVSTWRIYNELLQERPDVLKLLLTPDWPVEDRGHLENGERRAVMFIEDGKVQMNFVRYLLLGRPGIERPSSLPQCTREQVEALDVLEATALKHQLRLNMQYGDMTYVNNLAILHSREAFENDESHVRHLVRIWLRNEQLAWRTPRVLDRGFDMVFGDDVPEKWNIVPQPRLNFNIFQTLGP
ncbi:hypothetical protein PG991_003385 [Apiospora marii]|uniref:TauD/TfdA-like domain-containing protein n=1 Tax=Apiospora marii TaxID=335849 RepID=A0ABR1S357_9PEZI